MSEMDAVDRAQQDEIERLKAAAAANRHVDRSQQEAIDGMLGNQRVMFAIMVINAVASLAQITECLLVWWHGRGP